MDLPTDPRYYSIPDRQVGMLLLLLKDVTELLDKAGIRYCIDGGTLLGAVREKAFIRWDDDLDLGVPYPDYHKLEKVLVPLGDLGYTVEKYSNMYKVFIPGYWLFNDIKTVGTPTLDIFPWTVSEGGHVVRLADPDQIKKWPACWHWKKDLFPLKKYKFDELQVWGPNNPIPYLDRMYKDWRTKAVIELRAPPDGKQVNRKNKTITLDLIEPYVDPIPEFK